MKKLATILFLSALVACGGGGGDDDDDIVLVDAGDTQDTPDANVSVTCTATDSYGAATLTNQVGEYNGTPATPSFLFAMGALNADTAPDLFGIELYKGAGAFATGEIVPGTYNIAGQELNYATCGVCPRLFTEFSEGDYVDDYIATGGTVTIAQVSPMFEGSISNVTFQHVTIDGTSFQSTPHADGCTATISSLSWSITPTDGSM